MDNPFEGLKLKRDIQDQSIYKDDPKLKYTEEQKKQKRDEIYNTYTPVVYEVLDQLIAAYQPETWKKGNDCAHVYCCHINWFAGPEERYMINYDEHHQIRRRVEIALEQDAYCNPIGFKITNHMNLNKCIRTGLNRDDLIQGIKEAFE